MPAVTPPPRPVLTDGVVTLRAHREQDADAVVEQCRDAESVRWTTIPSSYQRSDALFYLAGRADAWQQGRSLSFALDDGAGYAGAVDLRPRPGGRADLGFVLHPRARGRGLMARAVRLAVAWGLDAADLEAVHWSASVGNWASRRVAWAAGFRLEGTVSRYLSLDDGPAQDAWIATVRRGDPLEPAHPWLAAPTILDPGGRVVLRAHRPGDAARMVEGCSDEVTRRWLPSLPVPYTTADADRHLAEVLEDHAAGRTVCWAMAYPDDDRMLGEMAIGNLSRGPDTSPEAGYWTHPEARGRSLTATALRLAARHALLPAADGGLGVHRLTLRAATGNGASAAVARRAGFRHWGTERQALTLPDGSSRDHDCFDLLAGEIEPITVTTP